MNGATIVAARTGAKATGSCRDRALGSVYNGFFWNFPVGIVTAIAVTVGESGVNESKV